jgi:hypothetical protein
MLVKTIGGLAPSGERGDRVVVAGRGAEEMDLGWGAFGQLVYYLIDRSEGWGNGYVIPFSSCWLPR